MLKFYSLDMSSQYPSVYTNICRSIRLFLQTSVAVSVCLYKHLSQYPSVYTNICHSICLFIQTSVAVSVCYTNICESIRLFIQTSVAVSVCLYKHLSQWFY